MRLQQAETTASDLVCCCCTYRLMKVRRCASVACYCGAATANESFRVLSRTAGEKEPRLQTPKLLAATATALVLRLPYATALLTALLPLPFTATATSLLLLLHYCQPLLRLRYCNLLFWYIDCYGWFFTACCYNDCATVRKLRGWIRGTVKLRTQPLAFRRTCSAYWPCVARP